MVEKERQIKEEIEKAKKEQDLAFVKRSRIKLKELSIF